MKRFSALFLQDLLLAYRSGHVLITAILLLIMAALVLFLPGEIRVQRELFYDAAGEGSLAAHLVERGFDPQLVFRDEATFLAARSTGAANPAGADCRVRENSKLSPNRASRVKNVIRFMGNPVGESTDYAD